MVFHFGVRERQRQTADPESFPSQKECLSRRLRPSRLLRGARHPASDNHVRPPVLLGLHRDWLSVSSTALFSSVCCGNLKREKWPCRFIMTMFRRWQFLNPMQRRAEKVGIFSGFEIVSKMRQKNKKVLKANGQPASVMSSTSSKRRAMRRTIEKNQAPPGTARFGFWVFFPWFPTSL